MPFTLVDQWRDENAPIATRGVLEIMLEVSPVLRLLPLITNSAGTTYADLRDTNSPNIGSRGVNQGFDAGTPGASTPSFEQLKILGGEVMLDDYIIESNPGKSSKELLANQIAKKADALGRYFTKLFFHGDQTVNAKVFDGLKRRVLASQIIDQGATSGGDALTLEKIDELIDAVDGGASALFMNKALKRKITNLARAAGRTTEVLDDNFGKRLSYYDGVPLVAIEKDEAQSDILSFSEVGPGGGSAACSSIYAVHFGDTDPKSGLAAVQSKSGVKIDDMDAKTSTSTPGEGKMLQWFASIAEHSPLYIARLQGIKNA